MTIHCQQLNHFLFTNTQTTSSSNEIYIYSISIGFYKKSGLSILWSTTFLYQYTSYLIRHGINLNIIKEKHVNLLSCCGFLPRATQIYVHQVRIQRGGGTGGPPPPLENHKLFIWVSIGNKQLDPPPPWKKLNPPGNCWTPYGTFQNDSFH